MASLIPHYEYDIFISYRHNDNRSGWVTEFVNALEEELAATIKEPLSIYFDKNPHDGLLETHNVDKSLEGKLKCLIFIPIISQTYCDPKSFAWQHEFVAFNKLALEDELGRDIKLSSGNVASRILPVKIHDLDARDKSLFENEIEGVLRAIELIYKEAGVNRPLKSSDSKIDNQNRTDYRNQVNKVANTIKDLLNGLTNFESIQAGTFVNIAEVAPTESVKPFEVSDYSEPKNTKGKLSDSLPALKILVVIVISSLLTALSLWKYFSADESKEVTESIRFSILPPPGTPIELIGEATVGVGRKAIDISSSGKRIVFIGNHNGRPHIFVRDLDSFETKVIPQTEGAYACTLSPDASEVAYFVGNSLQKIRIDGGTPVALAEVANPMDIVWDKDNTVYFSADEGRSLYKYTQKQILLSNLNVFTSLSLLPDSDYILVSSGDEIGLYDLKSQEIIDLGLSGSYAKYLPTGDIVFMRGSTLMIAPFDMDGLKFTAEPREILAGLRIEVYGHGQFAFSKDGTFIYIEGEDTQIGGFTWLDRNGKTEFLPFTKENYGTFVLSPDQTKIAAPIYSTTSDIWVFDLNSAKKVRVTNKGRNRNPVWRNNNSLFVGVDSDIYLLSTVQNANPSLILKGAIPQSVSSDGQMLLVFRDGDLFKLNLQTQELLPITNTPKLTEFHGSLSPDGSLVAYTKDDSRAFHVYLQHAVNDSKVVQISTREGSEEPRWSGDGKTVVYRSGQQWMEVEVLNRETLEVSKPKVIAEGDYINISGFSFDISKNGQRLLLVKGSEKKTASEIRVIKNWFNDLKLKI